MWTSGHDTYVHPMAAFYRNPQTNAIFSRVMLVVNDNDDLIEEANHRDMASSLKFKIGRGKSLLRKEQRSNPRVPRQSFDTALWSVIST